MSQASLYRLMTWLSPSFPVGAFSYSHGLETAVERGVVSSADSLLAWLAVHVRMGAGLADAILLRRAHDAFVQEDMAAARTVVQQAVLIAPTAEIRRQNELQGVAFLAAIDDAWPCAPVTYLRSLELRAPLPVAVGAASAGHGLGLDETVTGFLVELTANLVSAGMRLIPLGQRDGQQVIAALEPVVAATADSSRNQSLDDIGSATPAVDIASMQHETQYTRLFRS